MQMVIFSFPCRVRQGFFAFIMVLAVSVWSAPKIVYSIVKNDSVCRVRISGNGIGIVKSGEILCDYTSQLDIDNALVHSPLSSIVVGASIDRQNHRVKLILNTTGTVSIESSEIVVIDLKVSGSESEPIFRIAGAEFKDPQGNVRNAEISPVNTVPRRQPAIGITGTSVEKNFLLNGRSIPKKRVQQLRYEMMHGDVTLRLVKKW